MNQVFKQRQKTIHLAITYLDLLMAVPRVFNKRFNDDGMFKDNHLLPLSMNEHLMAITCLLTASKFYEIDDKLIMSSDVQDKFKHLGKFRY